LVVTEIAGAKADPAKFPPRCFHADWKELALFTGDQTSAPGTLKVALIQRNTVGLPGHLTR
jgi:hypothetical protein